MQATNPNGQTCPIASGQQTTGRPAPVNPSPSLDTITNGIAQDLGYTRQNLPSTLSNKQTAKVLHVVPDTLALWRSKGREHVSYQKTGRYIHYSVQSLAEYILACSHTSTNRNGGDV